MNKLLLSGAMAVVMAVPALAAGISPQSSQADGVASKTRMSGKRISPGNWVQVTSADHLVGRDLRSKDGKQAGEIAGLVLDLPQGQVIYALIGSGGDLDIGDDRIAVPFKALQTPLAGQDGPLSLSQDLNKIRSGARVAEDQFAVLGGRDRMNQIYGGYGIAMPSGYIVPPAPQRDQHPNSYILLRPDLSYDSGGTPARAQDVRGSEIQRSTGETLGEIDQVMIDPTRGRIAYLLVSSGGFLGIGNDWLPVPPEAVSWSPDKNAFVLKDKDVKPAAMQVLHKTDLPGQVQRSQLEALYQRFNLEPYWEGGANPNQG